MARARSRANRQAGGWWQGWLAASGLLHAALFGLLLVFLSGGGDRPSPDLRVHLVMDPQASRDTPPTGDSAAPRPVPQSPALLPAAPMPQPEVAVVLPVEVSRRQAGAQAESASDEQHAPRPQAAPPAGAVEGGPVGGEKIGPVVQGIVRLPTGSGSGAGRANLDAADRGVGAGGGGSGPGGSGGGGVGAGTSGRGGGETGLASRGGGGGSADREAVAAILRSIRRRIEQAKTYPDAARREGTQGSVDLRFRIAADGSVEAVEILRSSGSPVLDAASQETIRRAAPYPVVQGWIHLPLSYRLAP